MYSIIAATILISTLHALIPSHWLPIIVLSKTYSWSRYRTLQVTLYMALAHILSTILLGILLSIVGYTLHSTYSTWFALISPIFLFLLGCYFIYRHYTHHHFHFNDAEVSKEQSFSKIWKSLVVLMFLSPCLEIEGLFLLAGKQGYIFVVVIASIYSILSVVGMLLWVTIAQAGIRKLDWHRIEHNAGLITGVVIIITGILSYFFQ